VTLEQAASIAAVVVTIAGAVVAVLARRDAKRAADAAERSAGTAEELAAIETDRRHEQLTPQLTIEAAAPRQGGDRVRLTVRLEGPDGLDRLDEVSVRVADDRRRTPTIEGGPTQQQLDETIWGPYRFVPGVDGADRLGRMVPAFPLARGHSRPLEMEPNPAPLWVSLPGQWIQDYAEQRIRLEIICTREGDPLWRVPKEIDQPQPRLSTTIEARRKTRMI
jgi:hypothetical protein